MQTEQFFKRRILNHILSQTQQYYLSYYEHKLRALYPIQQFKAIKQIIDYEKEFSQEFFLTKKQKNSYIFKIYQCIVLKDIQDRLKAPGSLQSLIENYNYTSQEGYEDIRVYFYVLQDLIKRKEVQKSLQKIFSEVIIQKGKEITQKMNKRKCKYFSQPILEYILDMLCLKKSIDKIVDQLSNRNFKLCSTKDKCYKKLLDSIESSRNLADFTDFTIKQCIRLKLDEERCYQKFADVFLILNSVSSIDSFMLYHQELLAKRIVDSLNEPKLEFELLLLKKFSQRMGVLSVSPLMSMVKDIQLSQQITQKYNNRLPFSSFKWNLKIFNPSYWPENINKQKLLFSMPNYLIHQAKAIQDLYHMENQYRFLNWKLQRGTSLFQGKFWNNKKYRFQSENSYMMVLFMIEEQIGNKIMFGNLKYKVKVEKGQTQLKNDPLSMLLYVLIENRLVLRNNSEDKFAPFLESQELEINRNYSPVQGPNFKPQQVIIIRPSPQIAKKLQQTSIQKNKIQKDRQKVIEAVLVKVLKHSHATGNNCVTFSQLYKSIQQHQILGAFNYPESTVKKILEELIARQYCQRDQEDRKVYHYIA